MRNPNIGMGTERQEGGGGAMPGQGAKPAKSCRVPDGWSPTKSGRKLVPRSQRRDAPTTSPVVPPGRASDKSSVIGQKRL
jgi:hypothetical protein